MKKQKCVDHMCHGETQSVHNVVINDSMSDVCRRDTTINDDIMRKLDIIHLGKRGQQTPCRSSGSTSSNHFPVVVFPVVDVPSDFPAVDCTPDFPAVPAHFPGVFSKPKTLCTATDPASSTRLKAYFNRHVQTHVQIPHQLVAPTCTGQLVAPTCTGPHVQTASTQVAPTCTEPRASKRPKLTGKQSGKRRPQVPSVPTNAYQAIFARCNGLASKFPRLFKVHGSSHDFPDSLG